MTKKTNETEVDKVNKTYFLDKSTVDNIDKLSNDRGCFRKTVIDRAVKVYAMMDNATSTRLVKEFERQHSGATE